MKWGRVLPVFLVLMLAASTSFAAGFRLPEAGVKAMGMGFAFTAQADDPSAIYFNPAGLTQLEGKNLMLGATYVKENGGKYAGTTPVDDFLTGFTTQKSETQKTLHFLIPNGYFTSTNKETGIAWGIGVFAPFGLGQQYVSNSASIFRNQTTKIDLQTVVINPTIAFEINEMLSVGFGIDYMYGTATLGKTPWSPLLLGANNGNVYELELEGDGDAWGYNFGILLKPTPNLRIGANYRSPFELNIKGGDVDLSNINPGVAPLFGGSTFHTQGDATVSMPATFAIGVAYTWDRLTVEADADWTFWSSYESLPITIKDEVPPGVPDANQILRSTDARKDWRDVCALRLGAEYRATDKLALRAGFVYDPTPVPAETMGPELPDSTRLNYMLGLGYKFGSWTIDVAGMYIDKKDRTVNNQVGLPTMTGFNGTWTGDAWLAGLDVGYKF